MPGITAEAAVFAGSLPASVRIGPADIAAFLARYAASGDKLDVTFTEEDPIFLTKPWTWTWHYVKGTQAPLTNFSFYANKNLSTAEGGMLTTAAGTR